MNISKAVVPIAVALAGYAVSGHAQTACQASTGVVQLSNAQVSALLTGRTVCGLPGANYPGAQSDRFQEEHLANGDLFDYKRGPGHAVDPREKVGTWALGGSAVDVPVVVHRYGPSTVFVWTMFGPAVNTAGSSVYSFCSGNAEHVRAHVIATGSGCSAFPANAMLSATRSAPKGTVPTTAAAATSK